MSKLDIGDRAVLVILFLAIVAIMVLTILKGTSWLWEGICGAAENILRGG